MESSRQDGSFDMEQFLECQLENSPTTTELGPEPENDVMVNPDTILEIDQILMEQSEKIAYTDENEMDTNDDIDTSSSSAVGIPSTSISQKITAGIKGGEKNEAGVESSPSSNNPSSQGQHDTIQKPKRKKKKSRNGSIYVGVGNRIDWMNLQTKFGFENVAYFAAFVNETMRLLYEDFTKHCEQLKENREEIIGHKWISGLPVPYTKDGLINQNQNSGSSVEVKEEVISHFKNMGFDFEEEKVQENQQKLVKVTEIEDKKEESMNNSNSEGSGSQMSLPELEYHGPLSVCEVVQDEDNHHYHLDMNLDMNDNMPILQPINQNASISNVKSKTIKKKSNKKAKKEKVPPIPKIPKKRGPKGKGKKEEIPTTSSSNANAQSVPVPTSTAASTINISPTKEKLTLKKTIKKREPRTSKGKKIRLPKNFINFDTSSNLFPTNNNNNSNNQ